MKLGNLFVLVLACILLVSGNADAKIKHGEINTDKDMAFLDYFYFKNTEDNVLDYEIKYPADQCCYRLVIFDESYGQWGGIRPNEDRLTCRGMIDRVKDLDFKIKLSDLADRDEACHIETDDAGRKWLVCRGHITFESRQRPQSYFVHLTNCRSNRKGLRNVSFSLHMTNGNHSLMKEIAENQKFIMETDLAFLLGYMAIMILATRFRYVLVQKKMLHLTYRLFYSSLFFKTLCLLLLNIELSRFARTGLETTTMQDAAEIFSCLSSILFVSVLLLVSKGFSITRAHPSLFGTVKMILFGLLYAAAYAVVFFDQRVFLDPQDIIASRTSLSASGLIGIKIGGCIIFVYGCFFTIKNHPTKLLFYLPFTVFFSAWFLTEPIYQLLSVNTYPVLRSPNIWNGIDLALCFAGHAFFVYITRPDRLNKRFPFHLRAAKISFRDVEENLDNPYQPADDFYSVFQTGQKPTGTDTILTIPDEFEHFSSPVLPFNTNSDECLVLSRPTSPVVPEVSATTTGDSSAVIPTVSAAVADPGYSPRSTDFELTPSLTDLVTDECRVPATRRNKKPRPHHVAVAMPETTPVFTTPTGLDAMPKVTVLPPIKNKVATSSRSKALPTLNDTPKKDRTAVGISTALVPKGGFSIFSVESEQDAVTSPKGSDKIVPEREKEVYSGVKIAPPKGGFSIFAVQKPQVSDADVMDQKQEMPYDAIEVRPESPLPLVKSSSRSFLSPPIKTIEGPGSDVRLNKTPENGHLVTCRPFDEPLKTKATEESRSDVQMSNGSQNNSTVRQISVRPAGDPFKTETTEGPGSAVELPKAPENAHLVTCRPFDEPLKTKATGESGSDVQVSYKSQINGTVRKITVRSADDPFKTKTIEGLKSAVQASKSEGMSKPSDNVHQITVRSSDEPLPTKTTGGHGSAAEPLLSLDVTTAACSTSDSKEIKDTILANKLATWAPEPVKSPKIECRQVPAPPADLLKMSFSVPAPKILNWTTEPFEPQEIEHSKSSPGVISGQPGKAQKPVSLPEPPKINSSSSTSSFPEEPLNESIQEPGPHVQGPRSVDHDLIPAVDGGDFVKPAKKTRKEPSYRRFPKPDPGLKLDTTPDDGPQKAAKKTRKEPSYRRFPKPNPGLKLDTAPDDGPQKAMDPRTKRKKLKKFLKLARRLKPKNKPAIAAEEPTYSFI